MKNTLLLGALLMGSFIGSAQTNNDKWYEIFQKNTMEGTKQGLKNKETGQEMLPAAYDKIMDISSGKFAVIKERKVGVVDSTNKTIIPILYADVSDCIEGRIFMYNGKKWAMFTDNGKAITQFVYDEFWGYSEGLAKVKMNGKFGYVNSQGIIVIPCKYNDGSLCINGTITVYSDVWVSSGHDVVTTNRQGKEVGRQNVGITLTVLQILNKKGEIIYKGGSGERAVRVPGGKLFLVETSGFDKLVDMTGKVIVSPEKKYRMSIKDHWISVSIIDEGLYKYGVINFNGEVMLKPYFTEISSYGYNDNLLAKVSFPNGEYFFIGKDGKCVEFDNKKCPE